MMRLDIVCFYAVLTLCRGWVVQIDSHVEECFYERVNESVKLSLVFQVVEGGFLDIDVTISGPDEREIYVGTRETNGKYTFTSYKEGKYRFCFSNKMSTVTPKIVMFDVSVGDVVSWQHDEEDHSNSSATLQASVGELARGLWGINSEQEYIIARMNMHHRVNEHTNRVLLQWCIFEVMLITTGMCFEVFYIRKFFEVRRIV